MESEITSFDERIDKCIQEKRILMRDMKVVDMKLITFY